MSENERVSPKIDFFHFKRMHWRTSLCRSKTPLWRFHGYPDKFAIISLSL